MSKLEIPNEELYLENAEGDEETEEFDSVLSEEEETEETKEVKSTDTNLQEIVYEKATIVISMVLLPEDNDPQGRPIILSASNEGGYPVSKWLRYQDISPLTGAIAEILDKLKTDLPNREMQRKVKALHSRQNQAVSPASTNPASTNTTTKAKRPVEKTQEKQLTLW